MSTNPGRIDKYELQDLLGQGEMTEVWKAFDTQSRRYVAIKFLRANLQVAPDFVTRFQRETLAIASLHHPNIVQYHDFSISQLPGTGNVTAYMVMDFVDGGTLAGYVRNTSRQGKFLPAVDILRLFTSIGMAVDYAHQHGRVHGQLKPTNILLDKRDTSRNVMGEPIVTDFGMDKLLGIAGGNTGDWRIGTPLYTAPEQIMGSPADERSDIYSLGIMLYEICTGTPPFLGNNAATIIMQHMNTAPASPALINPGLPPALITIITRCIAKEPWARFPTASSLVEALAQAIREGEKEDSNIPIPVNVSQPDYSVRAMDLPTVLSSGLPSPPPGRTPSSPGISGVSFSSFPSPAATSGSGGQAAAYNYTPPGPNVMGSSQPYPAVQPGGPITPMPSTFASGQSAQSFPATPYEQPPTPPASRKPGKRGLWIALAAPLILALIGSGLVAYFAFFSKGSSATTSLIVGHAYFVSSGLLSSTPESSQGITDQVQIKLDNIPSPPPGKSYYAWLLNDRKLDWKPILLGPLTANNGTINFAYPGDLVHSNLLATNSRFFITEEDAATPPINPDPNAVRYYAEFSQTPNPADTVNHFSLYDHIRHLLSDDPKVKAAGLSGGLDIWLYRNTQKILEWAGSARDAQKSGNLGLIHRQLIRIMDYLDGTTYTQLAQDLPGQSVLADPAIAKIGLLTFDPAVQNPPGYLYHIGKHLHEVSQIAQASTEQKGLATLISQELNVVNGWFETMRTEALQLFQMTDAQLVGSNARSLLDSLATLANTAFVGQINPQGQVTPGIVQIHYDIQQMATFDIRACTASNPCPALV
ncbi:MAG TPA: protein kinase [Ktedonobacteraceae bacterium]|nr:protein kinase [Ktedonobacteraceae bacterium]